MDSTSPCATFMRSRPATAHGARLPRQRRRPGLGRFRSVCHHRDMETLYYRVGDRPTNIKGDLRKLYPLATISNT